jgi:hypothetical protein
MTRTRFALSFIGILLAGLLALGIYGYRNLPTLLEGRAQSWLQDYGVQAIRLQPFHFDHRHFSTDKLWLRLEHEGLVVEATVSSIDIGYNWRALLLGELQAVSLAQLDLTIKAAASSDTAEATSIDTQSLLPQQFIDLLPLQSLDIKQLNLRYQSPDMPVLSATGSLQLNDRLHLNLESSVLGSEVSASIQAGDNDAPLAAQLTVHDGQSPISELSLQLAHAPADLWQWSVHAKLRHSPALQWLRRLDRETQLPLDLSALEGLQSAGDSELNATVQHSNIIDTGAALPQLVSQFQINAELANNFTQLHYPSLVEEAAGRLNLALQFAKGDWQLRVDPTEINGYVPTALFGLPQGTQQWLGWKEKIKLQWRNPQPLQLTAAEGGKYALQVPDSLLVVGSKASELRWESLALQAGVENGQARDLDAQLTGQLKVRLRKQQLPQMGLSLQHKGLLEAAEFKLSLDDTAESMSLSLQGQANLLTGAGDYTLNARSLDLAYATSSIMPLLQHFELLEQSVEITGGSVELATDLRSQSFDTATWQQKSQLALDNVSGSFDEYQFEGLNLAAHWSGIERWQSIGPAQLSLSKLDVGFDLVDIRAKVALPRATDIAQPVVRIEEFSAGAFGGRVFLPEARTWDFGATSNKATLRAEHWQLAELVALQQDQDIEARGILEGELPVTATQGRIIIEKGYLRALPPGGSIRYIANESSRALAASSPELGLALDLLSDFQYQVLSTEVELDQAGNLLLGLSLAGKNPERYEGRPINFNINLEQNIDPLLQSLRLSDKLVEKLENRLQ